MTTSTANSVWVSSQRKPARFTQVIARATVTGGYARNAFRIFARNLRGISRIEQILRAGEAFFASCMVQSLHSAVMNAPPTIPSKHPAENGRLWISVREYISDLA